MRLLEREMGEVSGLTSALILGGVLDGLECPAVGSFLTLGSALTLVCSGVETLEAELTGRIGVPEGVKAGTDGDRRFCCNALLDCGVVGALRVDAGVLAALPLASGEAMVEPLETVLPLAILVLVPVLVVPAESWSIDTSTSPTFIVILVFLLVAVPGSGSASLCLRFLPVATALSSAPPVATLPAALLAFLMLAAYSFFICTSISTMRAGTASFLWLNACCSRTFAVFLSFER